ncbi:MAG TPA: diguanylate cyclase [Fimbriimonadaceae bacterium]|nr:diguanylate cyclase [Fimbriimonadaceae bacterium]
MRILIAEDDKVSMLVLSRILEQLGHEVVCAADGAEAWQILSAETFDAIVSDWMMPEMDGLELCRRLRAEQGRAYTYFILLTAKAQQEARAEALAAGVDDFLVKPLQKEELMARLTVARRILDIQDALRTWSTKLEMTAGYLETANRRFSDLFIGLPVACLTFDLEGKIMEWNRAAETLFMIQPEDVWQASLTDVVAPENPDWVESFRARALERGVDEEEVIFERRDGAKRYVVYSAFPLRGQNAAPVGIVCTANDITERRELEKRLEVQLKIAQELNAELDEERSKLATANHRLEELAATDALTGLRNRRAYEDVLHAQYSFAIRQEQDLSLILLDVDHFKSYNDNFGHPAGDVVLRDVAQTLVSNVRAEDLVARYGGEEFVVVLPITDRTSALVIAEKLRAAIEQRAWPHRPITISLGVATLTSDQSTADLVDAADNALYAAKQAGRNRVWYFDEQPMAA